MAHSQGQILVERILAAKLPHADLNIVVYVVVDS